MTEGTLLKRTRSLCPVCLKEIDAEIREINDEIIMLKECKTHGRFSGLIERDTDFYRKTMNRKKIRNKLIHTYLITVTHRCNLRCSFCYVPNRTRKDPDIRQLERVADRLSARRVYLTGGEPTMREDLPDIIRMLKKKGTEHVGLLTNGTRLSDPVYVKKLEDAGLDAVLLSFNGFSDSVYKKINNKSLLRTKLAALKNMKESNIMTVMSPTLVRGLNESEIRKIIECILDAPKTFFQLRIRGAAMVGTHSKNIDPLSASEMLDITARALGLSKESFLKGFRPDECYHSPYQFNIRLVFIESGGKSRLVYWDFGDYSRKRISLSRKSINAFFTILMKTLSSPVSSIRSWRNNLGLLGLFYRSSSIPLNRVNNVRSLDINIWGWPDIHNIDLNDIQGLNIKHMKHNGEFLNFFEAMMITHEL